MKKFIAGILAFFITFEVAAKSEADCSRTVYKSKKQFCNCMDKLVSTGKTSKLEPTYENESHSKRYTSIDLDKDSIYEEVNLSCGSSGECGLSIMLSSSGREIWLNENLMFNLTQIDSDIYVPVIAGIKEDFSNESSALDGEFYLREKHLARLYKLTANKVVLICKF